MNREIKFRMWNIHFKKMTYNPPLWSASRGGIDELNTALKRIEQTEKHILMQFTGLQDKNGKDIYEGDIVRYYNKYSKLFYTHQVMWDNKWAAFGLFEQGNEWCKEIDWVKISEIEVIGNIYENPELLTT
jgi:uncharacterized phage protein (TIGR01671 family)